MAEHIVWDWNGTLFHDIDALVEANNAICRFYGLPALDLDSYRDKFTRPVWVMYERMLGRPLAHGEWEALDERFHRHYHRLMATCGLADGALPCLAGWAGAGLSQSLLSMWGHDRLVEKVREFGIAGYFSRIDGTRGSGGGHKAEHLAAHIGRLNVTTDRVVVIGDSVDDAHAARHVGAHAVLVTGGQAKFSDLKAAGVPVVGSLADAVERAAATSRAPTRHEPGTYGVRRARVSERMTIRP
jgi:phosphoglycolate phosphatase-like HAD superfamily hydrolase